MYSFFDLNSSQNYLNIFFFNTTLFNILIYGISRPIRHTFLPKNLTYIRPGTYAPKVVIISKK